MDVTKLESFTFSVSAKGETIRSFKGQKKQPTIFNMGGVGYYF